MKWTVEHIGLASADPQALKDWYVRVFEAVPVFADGKEPPAFLLRLPGDLLIEIYPASSKLDQTSGNGLAGWRHLALRVDSIEGARDWLATRGVNFHDPIRPAGGGGRVLFFEDAERNLWHLVERDR